MEKIVQFLESSDWQLLVLQWGMKLLVAMAIFVFGRWIAHALARALRRLMLLREMDQTLVTFMSNLVNAILVTAVLIAAVDYLGMPVTSLLAILGAAGLAVGLALKDSLGNFAAGVMLVMFLLGFVLDFIEITFVVVPIVGPALMAMGLDPIWLGVMIALNLQTSFLTPPFGFSLFYLRGVCPPSVNTSAIYRGVMPFIGIQLLMLLVLALWPTLVLWLPGVVYTG